MNKTAVSHMRLVNTLCTSMHHALNIAESVDGRLTVIAEHTERPLKPIEAWYFKELETAIENCEEKS